MIRASYAASIFLDPRRIVVAGSGSFDLSVSELCDVGPTEAPGPVHFIFHLAHGGSTLLARAVDCPGRTLVLREPFALRQLAVATARGLVDGTQSTASGTHLALLARLLGRRYQPAELVVVKANVPVNFLIEEVVAAVPGASALILHSSLGDYLPAILRTPKRRRWARTVLRSLRGHLASGPLAEVEVEQLPDARVVAVLWLAQMVELSRFCARGSRVASLGVESWLDRPREALAAIFGFWGDARTPEEVNAIVGGKLFSHHSKTTERCYDNRLRQLEREASRRQHMEAIEDALTWATPWVDRIVNWDAMNRCELLA